jgi:drug/metabolite transporter (DMT)-like permease
VAPPAEHNQLHRHDWKAYGALATAIAGIVWSAIFVRWAAVPGTTSAFYRVLIAACVLLPWRLARARTGNATGRRWPDRTATLYALAGGALFGCDIALYNTAVLRTTAANATLFGNNAPIFVGLGSWLIFKRRPPQRFWIGLGLALAGAVVVMLYNAGHTGRGGGQTTGNLLAVGAAIFFAGYMLTTERAREAMDTLTFSAIAAAGSVVTLLIAGVLAGVPLAGFGGRTWAALLALGLISQLGAYLALAYALGRLPATITSVGLLAQVPLTALLAVPLLGERITAAQMMGGALVLAGIFIVNRPGGGD